MSEIARPTSTLMSVEQAADYLGLAVSTLNKWRCVGNGPTYFKMGRAVRYAEKDLEDYLISSRAEMTAEYQ